MKRLMWTASRVIQSELGISGRFWEGPYFPRRIRNPTHFVAALAYDHLNPVRGNLVSRAEDYARSSAAWWAENGDSPIALLKRPLPFDLEIGEFRQTLLAYQASKVFSPAMQEYLKTGADPSSAEGCEELKRLLRELGLE
jgi:hypothetical protein